MPETHNPDFHSKVPIHDTAILPFERYTVKEIAAMGLCAGLVLAVILFWIAARFDG